MSRRPPRDIPPLLTTSIYLQADALGNPSIARAIGEEATVQNVLQALEEAVPIHCTNLKCLSELLRDFHVCLDGGPVCENGEPFREKWRSARVEHLAEYYQGVRASAFLADFVPDITARCGRVSRTSTNNVQELELKERARRCSLTRERPLEGEPCNARCGQKTLNMRDGTTGPEMCELC